MHCMDMPFYLEAANVKFPNSLGDEWQKGWLSEPVLYSSVSSVPGDLVRINK